MDLEIHLFLEKMQKLWENKTEKIGINQLAACPSTADLLVYPYLHVEHASFTEQKSRCVERVCVSFHFTLLLVY